jgi:hypothetical protein
VKAILKILSVCCLWVGFVLPLGASSVPADSSHPGVSIVTMPVSPEVPHQGGLQPLEPGAAMPPETPKDPKNPKEYRKKFQKIGPPWIIYPRKAKNDGMIPPTGYIKIGYWDLASLSVFLVTLVILVISLAGGPGWLAWLGMVLGLVAGSLMGVGCRRPTVFMWAVMYYAFLMSLALFVTALYGPSLAVGITLGAFILLGVFFLINWPILRTPS